VPEKFVPHFKAGKELRERVDFKNNCNEVNRRAASNHAALCYALDRQSPLSGVARC
jgi:hypothetical protein